MIEKIKRKKKIDTQDLQPPQTIKDLIRRYDLDNIKIKDYLDYLVDSLDESGTWTPELNTVEGIAPTYTTTINKGSYKKINNMVFISFFIRGSITALNGNDNYALIKGLPFASASTSSNFGMNAISVGDCYNCVTTTNEVHYIVYNNAIRIQTSRGSAATKWQVTPSGGYFIIAGSGWYEIE